MYILHFLLCVILIRPAHEQSEQRSEQKASAQEAAMAMPMMTMATMATTAAENHVPQGHETRCTQHCDVPPYSRSVCTGQCVAGEPLSDVSPSVRVQDTS